MKGKRARIEASTPHHVHIFDVPTPDGRRWVDAICRICGEARRMRQSIDDSKFNPFALGKQSAPPETD